MAPLTQLKKRKAIAIARRQCPHCRVSRRLRAKNSLGTMSCTQTVHRSHTTWEQLLNFFSLKLNWLINMFSVRSLPFYSRILFNLTKLVGNIDNMLLLEQSLKVSAAASPSLLLTSFKPRKMVPFNFWISIRINGALASRRRPGCSSCDWQESMSLRAMNCRT